MPSQKPILIAGAGLSSLLLGRSLHRSKIPFLIYERDASLVFRAQGYRLRMSPEGLSAVESVLGAEGFQRFYDRCGKTGGAGVVAVDPLTGETLSEPGIEDLKSKEGKVVGIARGTMREVFLEGIEANVKWGTQVVGYEVGEEGVRAVFKDGTKSEEGSMIVGGEGVRSHVGRQLSKGEIKVFDLGGRGIHVADIPGQAPTPSFHALGEGVFRLVDSTSHPNGRISLITNVRPSEMHDPSISFGWTLVGSPGVVQAPNDDFAIVGQPAAAIAKDLTKTWHARIKPLFDNMDEKDAAFWKITCSDPKGVAEWRNEERVTVIGDAVHAMTPAGGNGANTALRDSALLGRLLGEAGGYAPGVTAAYEKEMRVYASEMVAKSYGMAAGQFGGEITESTPRIW